MKKHLVEFLRRGFVACGFGPMVLAVVYLVLQQKTGLALLTVGEVCTGIFSLTVLAFLAGGMNFIYQVERLPLMAAVFIHGIVLYMGYLAAYLLNDWLAQGMLPILVFTVIFIVGYLLIWVIIYAVTRQKTKQLNKLLAEKRQQTE